MDIKFFQSNLALTDLQLDKYADIVKQNENISKQRAEIYSSDRNFNKISKNYDENYISIHNGEPIRYKTYKDYTIYSDNTNLLFYEGTRANYAINKDTDTNFISKLGLADKMFLLSKNDILGENTEVIVKDDKYFMQKMINDMVVKQTDNILGNNSYYTKGIAYALSEIVINHSYADKFNPNSNYEIEKNKNYYSPISTLPNSYYLNSYANSNLIDTKFGKAELFLDLAGDNDKLGVGNFSSNSQLFRFDSDSNGIVDKNDTYFDKLKIRAYDKNGNEIIKKLSEVVDYIDLRDFIDTQSNAIKKWKEDVSTNNWDEETYKEQLNLIKSYNPYAIFKPEIRYESINETDLKELSKLADKDGWIDAINLQGLVDLAYVKQGVDGNYRLNELNYTNQSSSLSYTNDQYSKFNALYEDYMAELEALNNFFSSYKQIASDEIMQEFGSIINNPEFKSTIMLNIEKEFKSLTGLTLA